MEFLLKCKKPIILSIALLTIVAILYLNQLLLHLIIWQIHLSTTGLNLVSVSSTHLGGALTEESLIAKSSDTELFLTRSKTASNNKFFDDKRFLLESQFEPTKSSYPGVITNVIDCPDKFKPIETRVPNGSIFPLDAGERFNYGICIDDLVVYS